MQTAFLTFWTWSFGEKESSDEVLRNASICGFFAEGVQAFCLGIYKIKAVTRKAMTGSMQQNMFLIRERRRQPVLTEGTRVSGSNRRKAGFESMSGLSFEDVRVHYSSLDPARTGAYVARRNVYPRPVQEKHLSHEPAPAQMCPGPGDARPSPDSEDELESFLSESDQEDHMNVSSVRMEGRSAIRHVSNDEGSVVGTAKSREELEGDAKAIHGTLGGRPFSGSTTVVCAVLAVKGGFLHIAMINNTLMMPEMREKARELGYTVIRGIKSHAEANMILYAHKHKEDARLIAFGCDKDTCPECAKLLDECFPGDLKYTTRPLLADGTEDFSPKYHFRSTSKKPVGIGPFVARMQSVIDRDYEDGARRDTTSAEVIGCMKDSGGIVYTIREEDGTIQQVPSDVARIKYQREVLRLLETKIEIKII